MNLQPFVEGVRKTKLIYYEDSYLRKFKAKVFKFYREKKHDSYIALDRTAFHPKSGGQPSDKGYIWGEGFKLRVKKCILYHNVVVHYGKIIEGDSCPEDVTGEIDWDWRYLLMRRHTAGHLFDYCLSIVCGKPVETLDSWLGDPCYVGYKGAAPSENELKEAERLENEFIEEGRPVSVEYVSFKELLKISPEAPNIFRLPKLKRYRIVRIEGFQPIPCGGTHLKNIKEIGRFKVIKATQIDDSFKVYYDVF